MKTRFIILSTARTGSNLLMFLLRAHKNIEIKGEIFNLSDVEGLQLKKILSNPLSVVSECLDTSYSEKTLAVGFKLFYNHLSKEYFQNLDNPNETQSEVYKRIKNFLSKVSVDTDVDTLLGRFEETWQNLRDDSNIKIIHLKRENKLETLVSLKTAFITNQWLSLGGQDSKKITMELMPEECRLFFEEIDFYEKSYANIFKHHPFLDVEYLRLVEDGEAVLCKIFEFLEIPPALVKAGLKKQIVYPINEIVTNYYELKEYFSRTRWAGYFSL